MGISPGEWKPKSTLLQRKRLSDITNLPIGDFGDGLVNDDRGTGKTGSPLMINEYIAKLLKVPHSSLLPLSFPPVGG